MSLIRAILPNTSKTCFRHSQGLRLANNAGLVGRRMNPRRNTTTLSDMFEKDEPSHNDEFGEYDVILPKEPFVWGVSHIQPRPVPDHIQRPKYALPNGSDPDSEEMKYRPLKGFRTIKQGEDEIHLRNTARLASEILQYAGSLVNVSSVGLQLGIEFLDPTEALGVT